MTGPALARHRQESYRNLESLTPSDDVISWLGDDVCANCGAPARASHLFCSQQCKEEDAKSVNGGGGITSGVASASAPTLSQYAAPSKVAPTAPSSSTEARQEDRFRYPCPPSPNISAKLNSALTSPALIALEKSLPSTTTITNNKAGRGRGRASDSLSSSEESSIALKQESNRRSSSRSTFSSASDILSTDRSTPSPGSAAINRGEEDDNLSDLDSSDLFLPPSIHPAASILLNAKETKAAMTGSSSVTPNGLRRSPPSIQQFSSKGKIAKKDVSKTIDFVRRPSSTNLPPPVLFTSPVLASTTIKSNGRRSSDNEVDSRRHNRQSKKSLQDAQATLTRKILDVNLKSHRSSRPSIKSTPYSSPAVANVAKDLNGALIDTSNSRRKWQMMHKKMSQDSPPPLPSASSSAGRTMRAVSPLESTSPNLHNAVCGRYGCGGLGSNTESSEEETSLKEEERLSSRRTSFARRHKHTHSAAAGLNFLASKAAPLESLATRSKIAMTPMKDSTLPGEKETMPLKEFKDESVPLDEQVMTPPRGRSKARGRRSTSRRSPSPPRGVARRGRSEDLTMMLTTSTRVSRQPSPISSSFARSNPISVSQPRRSNDDKVKVNTVESVDERRGRSPTERGVARGRTQRGKDVRAKSPPATAAAAKVVNEVPIEAFEDCEMAWPAYGHDLDKWSEEKREELAKSVATAIITGAKGYDDVDLDEL